MVERPNGRKGKIVDRCTHCSIDLRCDRCVRNPRTDRHLHLGTFLYPNQYLKLMQVLVTCHCAAPQVRQLGEVRGHP